MSTDRHHYTDDDGDKRECGDEGAMCGACVEKEHAYWSRYFGMRAGNTHEIKAHNRAQIEAFKGLVPRQESYYTRPIAFPSPDKRDPDGSDE